MLNFVLDALAGFVLLVVFFDFGCAIWNHPPKDDKAVNVISVILGFAALAAAIYRAGTHW